MAYRLSAELLHAIFSFVGVASSRNPNQSQDQERDQESVQDLLNCCLVCRSWRNEAQRALQEVIIINNHKQFQARLASRLLADQARVRKIIVSRDWDHDNDHEFMILNLQEILGFTTPHLQSLELLNGIKFAAVDRLRPTELANLSALRELTLNEHGFTGYWQPLLLSLPRLEHLFLRGVGWTGTPILPRSPSFNLKSLEILWSEISSEPLRWLLANSTASLGHLSVGDLQVEWDTFVHLSTMRAEGLLPKVRHLTFYGRETAGSSYSKSLPKKVTGPLTCWGGLESIYIRAEDAKMRGAIVNGIAAVSPPPVIELDASEMQFHELKGVFRLRKAKLQPGTILRLVTELAMKYRSGWEYWSEYVEDAQNLAQKHGVVLEIARGSQYAWL